MFKMSAVCILPLVRSLHFTLTILHVCYELLGIYSLDSISVQTEPTFVFFLIEGEKGQLCQKCINPFIPSHPTLNELEIPVEMVLTSLKQLDINKTTGSDGIPVHLLKETADQITPSLTMLFNKSLWLGIFPGDWKLANIVSIFQKKRETLWRIITLFPFSLASPKFSSVAFWYVYGIIYPTSSIVNSMAF